MSQPPTCPGLARPWPVILFLVLLLTACGGGGSGGQAEEPTLTGPFAAIDPNPGFDYALGMDAFADDSTVVCGWYPGVHIWEAGRPTETTRVAWAQLDGYVSRYAPDGQLSWVRTIIGDNFVKPGEVVALSDGSCIVMGSTRGIAIFAAGLPEQVVVDQGPTTFVARYLADGTLAWVRLVEGGEADIRDKCVFLDDSVAFCGRISATAVFGPGEARETDLTAQTTASVTDFVARFAMTGDLLWATAPSDGAGVTISLGVAALPDGSALVTGLFPGTAVFGTRTASEKSFAATGIDDGYIVRLSSTGTQEWARHFSGAGRELPQGATTLPNGTVAIVGTFTGASITFNDGELDAATITSGSMENTFVCRYSAAGSPVWSAYITHDPSAFLNLAGVVAFADDSIAVIGAGPGSITVDPGGPAEQVLSAAGNGELLMARYSSIGALDWARRDGGAGRLPRAEAIAAYSDGSIGFAGGFQGSYTVDEGGPGETTYPAQEVTDSIVIRYNRDGSHDGS